MCHDFLQLDFVNPFPVQAVANSEEQQTLALKLWQNLKEK
jgi:hypothetical protein